MKPFCLLFFVLFCFNFLLAQDDAICVKPQNCSKNLNLPLYGQQYPIKEATFNYSKNPVAPSVPAACKDVAYADDYGNAMCNPDFDITDCLDPTQALIYTTYYPDPREVDYTTCKLPCVLIFHGGEFADCAASLIAGSIVTLCQELAKRGFVAMSVEYRRGTIGKPIFYSAQQVLAIYRAAQDARGAYRSIKKVQQVYASIPASLRPEYQIDINRMFIGGGSAGSVAAMNAAYYNQSMMEAVFPGTQASLGPLDADFYFGETTIPLDIKGVLDMWGALPVPVSKLNDPSFFPKSIPVICFHGQLDPVFKPYYKKIVFASATIPLQVPYQSENHCQLDFAICRKSSWQQSA